MIDLCVLSLLRSKEECMFGKASMVLMFTILVVELWVGDLGTMSDDE